jgi:hypothetical protein
MSVSTPSSRPRGRHSRTKSGVPLDETPIRQGWLARESGVVDRLVNKRYGALYRGLLVTYRSITDDSPSKLWPLTSDVELGEILSREYHLRHPKTSTFWAVARGAYDKVTMWGFKVTWAAERVNSPESLTLVFDTKDEAEAWRCDLEGAAVGTPSAGALGSSGLRRLHSDVTSEASVSGGVADSPHAGVAPAVSPALAAGKSFSSAVGGSFTSADRSSSGVDEPAQPRSWATAMHINGMTVYVEEEDEEGGGGAMMVSSVVRAPPSDVFKRLVQVGWVFFFPFLLATISG